VFHGAAQLTLPTMFSVNALAIFATTCALIAILRLIFRTRIPKGLLMHHATSSYRTLIHPALSGLKLPPGPPGDFLIGNLRDIPSHHEWETYSKWQKKYGKCPKRTCYIIL
jgi:hypothetical protein